MTNVKEWLNAVAEHGCVITGDKHHIQIHHILGRKARRNKVKIGEWYVLPLHPQYHDVSSNHSLNVTHRKNAFEAEFGTQKELFFKLCTAILWRHEIVPPQEVTDAIETL